MHKEICINNKPCELMKAFCKPKYGSRAVLTDSCWEYVALFLKRQSSAGAKDALMYWNQAQSFYMASQSLPDSAKPLTSYYCVLNATKALLRFKGVKEEQLKNHGLSSVRAENSKTNIKETYTKIKGAGVLPELSRYFGYNLLVKKYSLADLLYNIPCIHRAYCITFSKPEIFVPIENPIFVKKENSREAWIKFVVKGRHANAKALKMLPAVFEHDLGVKNEYTIRMKKRFQWDVHVSLEERKRILNKYHEKSRAYLYCIHGNRKLWYVKKRIVGNEELSAMPSLVPIFASFHWISELVRYNPKLFEKYMRSKQNWLLHEFISIALDQFVDEISSEITGEDILCTGYR